jgi:hypothetical protein
MLSDHQKARVNDIARLITPESNRLAFLDLLENRLRGYKQLSDNELRHIAERAWRDFLRGSGPL